MKEISLVNHFNAVTKNAITIAKNETEIHGAKLNMDFVIAGGLLHDIGKILSKEVQEGKVVATAYGELLRHPISGSSLAEKVGLPAEIAHIIAVHSIEGDLPGVKRTAEAAVVHHADLADFLVIQRHTGCTFERR